MLQAGGVDCLSTRVSTMRFVDGSDYDPTSEHKVNSRSRKKFVLVNVYLYI